MERTESEEEMLTQWKEDDEFEVARMEAEGLAAEIKAHEDDEMRREKKMNGQTLINETVPAFKVKLTKYQKEGYGWEIIATPAATTKDVLDTCKALKEADNLLRQTYGVKSE